MTVLAAFPDASAATRAVTAVMASGLGPAACEFLDEHTVATLEAADRLGLPPHPLLFLEFHGASRAGLAADVEAVEELCRSHGAVTFDAGVGADERTRLWDARHRAYRTIREAHPGWGILIAIRRCPGASTPTWPRRPAARWTAAASRRTCWATRGTETSTV